MVPDTCALESMKNRKRDPFASGLVLGGGDAGIAGDTVDTATSEGGMEISPVAGVPGIAGIGFSRDCASIPATSQSCICRAIQAAMSCCKLPEKPLKQMPASFCVAPSQTMSAES